MNRAEPSSLKSTQRPAVATTNENKGCSPESVSGRAIAEQKKRVNRMRYQIQKAIRNPEKYSLHFIYVASNRVSIRAVSPYCWQGGDRFMGLCLSRENHRCFRLDQIHKLSVVESSELTMPFPMTELQVSEN